MNRKTVVTVATALIAIVSAASAVAGQVSGENANLIQGPFTSSASRSDVIAAAVAASRDPSRRANGEKAFEIEAPFMSTLTRAQVHAELLEAIRVGAIGFGGDYGPRDVPTQEQLESIRMAGQKALSTAIAAR